MAETRRASDFPRAAFAASAAILATFFVAISAFDDRQSVIGVLVIALVAGLLSGTWGAAAAVPVATAIAFGVAAATNGPSEGGGEPLPRYAVLILALVAAALVAGVAALGVLAGKVFLRPSERWLLASERRLAAGALLIALAVVAVAVVRDNRNDDRLGVVVRESDSMTIWSGKPWDGRGRRGMSEQEARSTTEFGVYWLGARFASLHLGDIYRTSANGAEEFTFFYGTCSSTGGGCAVPLSVQSGPICRLGPTPHDGQGSPQEVINGGAWLRRVGRVADGTYWIWTGDSFVTVHMNAFSEADIFAALATMSGTAPGGLRPPDFQDCPERPAQNAAQPSP